jgi:hypothetical protein
MLSVPLKITEEEIDLMKKKIYSLIENEII